MIARSPSRLPKRSRSPGGPSATGEAWTPLRPTCSVSPGDALAAGSDEARAADQVATLAAEATGASACVVWRYEQQGPVLAALSGTALPAAVALEAVGRARNVPDSLAVESLEEGGAVVTLQLGEPPQGALQLLLADEPHPSDPLLDRLGIFAVRAAHALRAGERRQTLSVELERTRALLTIVGQAIAQLSLAHTLDTAIEHVSGLLGAERLAVYLTSEPGRLEPAAERGLTGPHARVAERLLELLLGPARGRGLLGIPYAASDPRLSGVLEVLEELGLEAAIAVPLRVRDDLIGLLAVYPAAGRELTENEEQLLRSLAAQLAVAVQNARLHEETKLADEERKVALDAEREASRRLQALYEISRVFSESLSLDLTLEAVTRTIVETLEVDAASLRMPDGRGALLEPVAMHVREERLAEPLKAILSLPQPLSPVRPNVFRSGRAAPPRPAQRRVARPGARAARPVSGEGLDRGGHPARHAGRDPRDADARLARPRPADRRRDARGRLVDRRPGRARARQRAPLPAAEAVRRLDAALAAAARASATPPGWTSAPSTPPRREMDVGGDVYDFLELADGRLAVVLGDVTGHGIDAAADMAMAKFVFRSLAREHSEPSEFLAAANEIVLEEIGDGKFITMLYVTADGRAGEVACASAGHPSPRIVRAGAVEPLEPARARARDRGQPGIRGRARDAGAGGRRGAVHGRLARGSARGRAVRRGAARRLAWQARRAARRGAGGGARRRLPSLRRRAGGRLRRRRPQAHVIELARRDGRPLRIGHRGAAALARENSLEAIGLAVELGCDLVEFDVHALGETLVVAHDRPGSADGLPTLDEVLELLGSAGVGVHLDLKAQGAERPVAEALRRHGLVERTVVSSFRRPTLSALHLVEPAVRLGRTYPQDRTGLTKRQVFQPPARAIVRVLRRALPRRSARCWRARRQRRPCSTGRWSARPRSPAVTRSARRCSSGR